MKAEGSALLDQLLPAAPCRAATTRWAELRCAWAGDGNHVEDDDDEDDVEEENDDHYPAREAQLWCDWSAEIRFCSDIFLFADEELTIVYKKEKKNFVHFLTNKRPLKYSRMTNLAVSL